MPKIIGAIVAILIIATQLFLINGADVAEMYGGEWCIIGLIGLAFVVHRVPNFLWFFAAPVFVATLLSLGRWVPGYTEIEIARLAGWCALVLLVSQCETKWIVRALALSVLVQIAWGFIGVPWNDKFGLVDGQNPFFLNPDLYGWGLWRHHTRYASWMFTCMVAGMIMVDREPLLRWRITAWIIIAVALTAILLSYSNIFVIIAFGAITVWIGLKYNPIIILIVGIVLLFCAVVLGLKGFDIDPERFKMWSNVISESYDGICTLIGHGAGAFQLDITDSHPHNQLLNFLYDYGFLGVAVVLVTISGVCLFGIPCIPAMAGFLAVSLSTCINSARYADVSFCIAMLGGLCLAEICRTVKEQRGYNQILNLGGFCA